MYSKEHGQFSSHPLGFGWSELTAPEPTLLFCPVEVQGFFWCLIAEVGEIPVGATPPFSCPLPTLGPHLLQVARGRQNMFHLCLSPQGIQGKGTGATFLLSCPQAQVNCPPFLLNKVSSSVLPGGSAIPTHLCASAVEDQGKFPNTAGPGISFTHLQ